VIVRVFYRLWYLWLGEGEASPSERVTGETVETVVQVLDKIAPRLIDMCPLHIERIIDVMDKVAAGNPSAKAAKDIALHDIYGKTVRKELFRVLGGYRAEVLTDTL
jgi:L-alanine-DL-glutamate epimerase-like enolase superfamily enzyme